MAEHLAEWVNQRFYDLVGMFSTWVYAGHNGTATRTRMIEFSTEDERAAIVAVAALDPEDQHGGRRGFSPATGALLNQLDIDSFERSLAADTAKRLDGPKHPRSLDEAFKLIYNLRKP